MRRIVANLNRNPRQRSTDYGEVSREREQTGMSAGELTDIINTPAKKYERKRPSASLVRNELISTVEIKSGSEQQL
jgi:hypothetical protein